MFEKLKYVNNITEPAANIKIGLYTLEKGVTMNDDMVGWLEESKDVEVSVVSLANRWHSFYK